MAQDTVKSVNLRQPRRPALAAPAHQSLYKPATAPHVRPAAKGERAMATPTEIVIAFLARWDMPGGLDAAIRDCFTPGCAWENHGLAVTKGPDEAIALNAQLGETAGIAAIRVENLAVAATGNKVLTERIDHMLDAAGQTLFSAPVMGIFEIEDGRIAAWRDYFDSADAAGAFGQG
jgi:limonene-1,2-epoxide hydrolase